VLGLGCMRLSTEAARDDARSLAVLHAAFDAGITLVDTADAYCREEAERGHNERLIAAAISTWTGDPSRIQVATKGGLTRPNGLWVPNGRASHLAAACERSRQALGVTTIALYQLHAPDPKVPLATSVRALADLQQQRVVERIGLCNITVGQLEEARAIAPIASVQVELSPWQDVNVLNGVLEYCLERDIQVLAYRPLGGVQRRQRVLRDRVLARIAEGHRATPFEVALAWLAGLSPAVIPIPGATQPETVSSIARALTLVLSEDERVTLDEHFPAGRALASRRAIRGGVSTAAREGEAVLIMGLPGAGKTTLADTFVADGYARLNRDEEGGSLTDLLPEIDRLLAEGASRIVLDNTYASRASRAPAIAAARRAGIAIRCVWLSTPVEDAQTNAVSRMMSKYGRLLTPEEIRARSRHDANAFAPMVQFRYQRELEPPHPAEGFCRIDEVRFVRRADPSLARRAVILWLGEHELAAARPEVLHGYAADGWLVLGLSWQPGIADKTRSLDDVEAEFARIRDRLGVALEIEYCPHGAGPPVCWCRKPLPGLGVVFIHRHRLDAAACLYVASGAQDPGFARRLGFQHRDAGEFFA
jgi:aryl-alcohol dehydrogenase-like predicted oxidoreductase/predicted kinase